MRGYQEARLAAALEFGTQAVETLQVWYHCPVLLLLGLFCESPLEDSRSSQAVVYRHLVVPAFGLCKRRVLLDLKP